MIHSTRILIVEDRALDVELAEREIRKILPDSVFLCVETKEKFLEALEKYKPDLVLSDYSLPVFNGMEALNLISEYSPLTPLIIWTGSVSEEIAVQCMKAGAVNYVLKENGKRLPSAIIHALEEKRINLERIANENKAKEIQRKLEATINAIPDLLFEIGLSGVFYDYHSPRHELLFAPPSEFIGKSIFEVFPTLVAEICNSAIEQAYKTGYSSGQQFELKLPIGSRWFEISISHKKELTGENEPRFIVLSRDITNRKQAEEELKRSKEQKEQMIRELTQNNNDLLQFSYIISHNLRAPLSNLTGLLSLLDDIEIKDEYLRTVLDGFISSTNSLSRTLRDLQDIIVIKKQPSINQENINIKEMVENILGQINNLIVDSRPKIEVDFDRVSFIYFNRAYLESIFLNLFTNAIRYRDKNRSLEISIKTELEEDKVLFLFTDNGIGIDIARYKDRLFGFYQKFHNHPESKGFGLFLIKSQIESLGGSIEVNSKVGVGTSFLIKFPRNKNE